MHATHTTCGLPEGLQRQGGIIRGSLASCLAWTLFFASLTVGTSDDTRPWDEVGKEVFPEPVRPPSWASAYRKEGALGKHNDLPALLEAVHNEKWVTGKANMVACLAA